MLKFAHLMQWFQPGNPHSNNTGVTYDSSNIIVIADQIRLAKSVPFGIDGFIVDWYGPGTVNAFGDTAFQNLLNAAEIIGDFKAGICIDKGAIKAMMSKFGQTSSVAFANAYNYVKSIYALRAAFFSDFICEFGCGALGVNFGSYTDVIHDDPKYGKYFTWVGLPTGAASVATHYNDPNCVMGSVCRMFNDQSPSDCTQGIWGGSSRRMNDHGFAKNWNDSWKNIPQSMKYAQIVTWNDYEERTAVESDLAIAQDWSI